MNTVLELTNVIKRYDEIIAVNDISFAIQEGTITGFIGPNGAGKTTTIKMIMGLIRPSGGKIRINGHDILEDYEKAAANLAGIVEVPSFYPYLSGYDNLMQSYRIYNNSGKARLHELIGIVGLKSRIHDKVRKYSLGMKQRLGICRALIGTPKILLLDEPINGLDLEGVIEFRDLIRNIVQNGNCSILISSHILSEVEKICEKVILINKGKIKHMTVADSLETEYIAVTRESDTLQEPDRMLAEDVQP
jgi:ABC-2 type transport system ATP-binding protein